MSLRPVSSLNPKKGGRNGGIARLLWRRLLRSLKKGPTMSRVLARLVLPLVAGFVFLPAGRADDIEQIVGHKGHVRTIAFSPDGKWLLSGGADNQLLLWE